MLKIYPDAMFCLFSPLVGLADEGLSLDARLRPSVVSEEVVKAIYESELKPHYLSLDPRLQIAGKLFLRYVLYATNFNYRNEFRAMLPPFDCPADDPGKVFLWLWEVLFPDEPPLPLDQPFEIVRDVNVVRYILEGY